MAETTKAEQAKAKAIEQVAPDYADDKPVAVARATTPAEEEVQRIHDERMKHAEKHAAMAARTAEKAAAARFRPVKADE